MSSAIAKLTALLGMDASQFRREADDSVSKTANIESAFKKLALTAVGAFSVGKVLGMAKEGAQLMDTYSDMADQTGIAATEVRRLSYLAEEAGIPLESMRNILTRLTAKLAEAAAGNEKVQKTFANMGLPLERVARGTVSVSEAMKAVAEFASVNSGNMAELNNVMEVFGDRIGPRVLNVLAQFGEGKTSAMSDILSVTEEDIANMGRAVDQLESGLKVAKEWMAMRAVSLADVFSGGQVTVANVNAYIESMNRGSEDAIKRRKAAIQDEDNMRFTKGFRGDEREAMVATLNAQREKNSLLMGEKTLAELLAEAKGNEALAQVALNHAIKESGEGSKRAMEAELKVLEYAGKRIEAEKKYAIEKERMDEKERKRLEDLAREEERRRKENEREPFADIPLGDQGQTTPAVNALVRMGANVRAGANPIEAKTDLQIAIAKEQAHIQAEMLKGINKFTSGRF